MKKLLSVILAVCLVLSVVVFANAENIPDTTVHQALTSMIEEPHTIFKYGRFEYYNYWYEKGIVICGYDPDNTNVGGIISPNADNAYDTAYDGKITIPETLPVYSEHSYNSGSFSYLGQEKVVRVSNEFFNNIRDIKELTLPSTFSRYISSYVGNCPLLESVTIHEDHPSFCSADGVVFNKQKTSLIFYPPAKELDLSLIDGVESIESDAFSYHTKLETLVLPNSIKSINQSAFSNCKKLKSVVLPQGLFSINNSAFYGCTSLASINIPNSVKDVGMYIIKNTAFYNDTSNWENGSLYLDNVLLESDNSTSTYAVKNGTRVVAGFSFNNPDLVEIVLPDGIESISSHAVATGKSLKKINIPPSLWYIGNYALNECSLLDITLPDTVAWIGADALPKKYYSPNATSEDGLFYNGNHLIDADVFLRPSGVFKIKPGTKTISSHLFTYKDNITEVILPEGLASLNHYCFAFCDSLTYINIPSSVKYISPYTFQTSNPQVIAIVEENSYAHKALMDNKNVYDIILASDVDNGIRINQLNAKITPESNSIVIPRKFGEKKVTSIGKDVFKGHQDTTDIYLYENLTEIDFNAFAGFEDVVIHAYYGSYAEQFAKDNNFNLVKMYWYGDLSGDFEIKAEDALLVLHASVEKIALNQDESILADVDGDGDTTASDALAVLQKSVGAVKRFEVEK